MRLKLRSSGVLWLAVASTLSGATVGDLSIAKGDKNLGWRRGSGQVAMAVGRPPTELSTGAGEIAENTTSDFNLSHGASFASKSQSWRDPWRAASQAYAGGVGMAILGTTEPQLAAFSDALASPILRRSTDARADVQVLVSPTGGATIRKKSAQVDSLVPEEEAHIPPSGGADLSFVDVETVDKNAVNEAIQQDSFQAVVLQACTRSLRLWSTKVRRTVALTEHTFVDLIIVALCCMVCCPFVLKLYIYFSSTRSDIQVGPSSLQTPTRSQGRRGQSVERSRRGTIGATPSGSVRGPTTPRGRRGTAEPWSRTAMSTSAQEYGQPNSPPPPAVQQFFYQPAQVQGTSSPHVRKQQLESPSPEPQKSRGTNTRRAASRQRSAPRSRSYSPSASEGLRSRSPGSRAKGPRMQI